MWALGVVAFELLTGASPFAASNETNIKANIRTGALPDDALQRLSRNARAFITACLRHVPSDRPTAHELLRFDWLTGALRFLGYCPMLLCCAPEARRLRFGGGGGAAARLQLEQL